MGGAAIAISALSADYDYAPLLEMYEEAAADDFARWKAEPEDYPALSARAMEYAQFSTTRSTVYTLYDLDGNGYVSLRDLFVLLHWQASTTQYNGRYDLDSNGRKDFMDSVTLLEKIVNN